MLESWSCIASSSWLMSWVNTHSVISFIYLFIFFFSNFKNSDEDMHSLSNLHKKFVMSTRWSRWIGANLQKSGWRPYCFKMAFTSLLGVVVPVWVSSCIPFYSSPNKISSTYDILKEIELYWIFPGSCQNRQLFSFHFFFLTKDLF